MHVFNSNKTIVGNISSQLQSKMEIGASGAAGQTKMMQTLSARASIPEKDIARRVSVAVSKEVVKSMMARRPRQR